MVRPRDEKAAAAERLRESSVIRLKLVKSVLSDRIVRKASDPALIALAEIDPYRHRVVP